MSNSNAELEKINANVQILLHQAEAELVEHEEQQVRQYKIDQIANSLRTQLTGLIEHIQPVLSNQRTHLKGKVVIFGGHDRLITALKQQLPNLDFVAATTQSGNGEVDNAEAQITTADVVLIMTSYVSHAVFNRAKKACQNAQKVPLLLNFTGLTRCIQEIEQSLQSTSTV